MNNTRTAASLMLLFLLSLALPLASEPLNEGFEQPLLTSARSTACSGSVCINEVIPDPQGADTGLYPNGEWFELSNSGGMDVDLTGWKVTTSAGKTLAFNANTQTYEEASAIQLDFAILGAASASCVPE